MLTLIVVFFCTSPVSHADRVQVLVPAGVYSPFFRDDGDTDQNIPPLLVDRTPVTNREFSLFVRQHPEWRRSRTKPLYSEGRYLEHWSDDLTPTAESLDKPVTNVSWFAARQYCRSRGRRLLSTAEWEYVSDAQNPRNLDRILEWYGRPETLPRAAGHAANVHGLVGMHGLIWEWVDDFNSALIAGDSRAQGDRALFCGGGAIRGKDPAQYATFMRFAYRGSLRANSVGGLLGFRCAQNFSTKKDTP